MQFALRILALNWGFSCVGKAVAHRRIENCKQKPEMTFEKYYTEETYEK